jgi:hypothetical protein
MVADLSGDLVGLADRLRHELVQRGAVPASSVIVIVSVTPDLAPGPSNFLKLQRV